MTKAGKGRPDPKKRYGQKMKVILILSLNNLTVKR